MDESNIIVGIDLGTTFSAIAYVDEYGKAMVIPNSDDERITPSVVLFQDHEILVGKIAKDESIIDSEHVVQFIKRDMGNVQWQHDFYGKTYTPESISACIIKRLVQDASKYLQKNITKAVITVPAYFGELERKATQNAGELAGLAVLGIINEPTAAAIAYGLNQSNKEQKVLVYDLGGGTFDITVLSIKNQEIKVLVTDGEIQLGGKDWDDEIINYIAEQFINEYGVDPRDVPESYSALRMSAESAKIALSRLSKARIVCSCNGHTLKQEITREQFEKMTAPLLQQTESYITMLLEKAKLNKQEIDTILLVGGSTRMPQVKKMLAQFFEKEPNDSIHPDECVAIGAALYSTILDLKSNAPSLNTQSLPLDVQNKLSGLQITNVTAHSLGIIASDQGKKRNCILIPAQTPVPFEKQEIFGTEAEGQTRVLVEIIEGESENPEECTLIGTCLIEGLPSRKANAPIQVTFRYNSDGCIEVEALDKWTGKKQHTELQHSSGLTRPQIQKQKEQLQETEIL